MVFSDDSPQLTDYPRIVKGALITLDPLLHTITSSLVFQYNPETLSRSLQVQAGDRQGGARSERLRLQGPPVETIRLDAEFETTGSFPAGRAKAANESGIYPQLAALESLVYPTVTAVKKNMGLAQQGRLEIVPAEAPVTLLVWGRNRVLPIRVADFSITEEAYDINLNPIRAKVSLSLRVLNYNDLPWGGGGQQLFLPHHQRLETLAKKGLGSSLDNLRIKGLGGNAIASLLQPS